MRLSDEKDAHAQLRGHPFDLGFALCNGAHEFDYRFTHDDLLKRAEEIERLGRDNSLPVLWGYYGTNWTRPGTYPGRQTRRSNCPAQGRHRVLGREPAAKLHSPTMKALLAEAMALTGDLDNALHLIDEVTAQIERPGWEERYLLRRDPASQGLDALTQE